MYDIVACGTADFEQATRETMGQVFEMRKRASGAGTVCGKTFDTTEDGISVSQSSYPRSLAKLSETAEFANFASARAKLSRAALCRPDISFAAAQAA